MNSERIFQSIFEHSPIAIVLCDEDARILRVNRATLELFGIERLEDVDGLSLRDDPNQIDVLYDSISEDRYHSFELEYSFDRVREARHYRTSKRGTARIRLDIQWLPLEPEPGSSSDASRPRLLLLHIQDFSQRKRIEQQRQQSRKMEAIGRLAGSIAHDFNNILQCLVGFGELVRESLGPGHPAGDDIEKVLEAGQNGIDLVRQLLAFSSAKAERRGRLNLNALIQNVVNMVRPRMGEEIHIRFNQNPTAPSVEGDASQIKQVLLNLCVNARDAMPQGGVLDIRLDEIDLHAPDSLQDEFASGRYVVFSVSDTGSGIPETVRDRMFEPFFTTKEGADRAGLGLSTVYGIVKQHGGFLRIQTDEGVGTALSVFLPALTEETPADASKTEQCAKETESGSDISRMSVLVADDDELARKLTERILRGAGCEVYAASDGDEAVRIFSQRRSEIDILVFDVVMPGKSGAEAYVEIARIRPKVPVLFCSGYDRQFLVETSLEPETHDFLSKPYSARKLLDHIANLAARSESEKTPPEFAVETPRKGPSAESMGDESQDFTEEVPPPREVRATPAPERKRERPSTEQAALHGLRVLLVEDSDLNRRLFARRLASQGATVEECVDGREAVEAATQSAYDIMLIDLEMPVLDGFRAAELIRETDSDTPIVALSGFADDQTERRCLEIGFDKLLPKPVDIARLPETIREIVAKCAATACESPVPYVEPSSGAESK